MARTAPTRSQQSGGGGAGLRRRALAAGVALVALGLALRLLLAPAAAAPPAPSALRPPSAFASAPLSASAAAASGAARRPSRIKVPLERRSAAGARAAAPPLRTLAQPAAPSAAEAGSHAQPSALEREAAEVAAAVEALARSEEARAAAAAAAPVASAAVGEGSAGSDAATAAASAAAVAAAAAAAAARAASEQEVVGASAGAASGAHAGALSSALAGVRSAAAAATASAAFAAAAAEAEALAESAAESVETERAGPLGRGADPFFGSAEDVAHHRGNAQCWEHFDFGMLEAWDREAALFCAPAGAAAAKGSDGGELARALRPPGQAPAATVSSSASASAAWLRCRVVVDSHLPAATSPHTLCDGANLELDVARLTPTHCLASRPGYKCDGTPVHWSFAPGALSAGTAGCARDASRLAPASFPRDHLMDMFASFESAPMPPPPPPPRTNAAAAASPVSGEVVLLIAREREEHANPFHATTDFLNAFFALHVAGVVDGVAGSRAGMERVQVLLLDEQEGPFDEPVLGRVFSPRHPVLRVSALQRRAAAAAAGGASSAAASRLLLPHAVFVPPGYTNMLLAHVVSEGDCHAGTQLFQSFRTFVLSAFPSLDEEAHGRGRSGRPPPGSGGGGGADAPIAVTFVSRRPYSHFVQHAFIGRQVDNEEDLLAAMRAEPGVAVERLDFAQLSVEAQLAAAAGSEVLVGMHGAALTLALYMPPHGAVLELWPKDEGIWRCFEHLAAMAGLDYARWANPSPARFRMDAAGDYTTVDVEQFAALFRGSVESARRRRGLRAERSPAVVG